jgi:ankyrin repeat protein
MRFINAFIVLLAVSCSTGDGKIPATGGRTSLPTMGEFVSDIFRGIKSCFQTRMYWPFEKGNLAAAKKMLAGMPDVNAKDPDGNTPLCYAVKNGHIEIVKLLLTVKGLDLNVPSFSGQPALLVAVADARLEIVALLLAAGADINRKDISQQTVLHLAGQNENLLQLLLRHNPAKETINARDSAGKTPLIWLILTAPGKLDLAQMLITAGADVNLNDTKSTLNDYPLHIAVDREDIALVRLLVENGASPHLKNKYGMTPLDLARLKKNDAVLDLLTKPIPAK